MDGACARFDNMKMTWPECVGKTVEEARAMVMKEFPDVHIQVLGPNQPATMDYCIDRVRIVTNHKGTVFAVRRG